MEIVQDNLWLCGDCLQAAVNNDYSGLDYYLSEGDALTRMAVIQAGLDRLGGGLVMGDKEEEFSRTPCACCGDRLAGFRAEFRVLGGPHAERWYAGGNSSIWLDIPQGAITDCTVPGQDATESVTSWLQRVDTDHLDPVAVAAELGEYGAWDTEELEDHGENLLRLLWIACGDLKEARESAE